MNLTNMQNAVAGVSGLLGGLIFGIGGIASAGGNPIIVGAIGVGSILVGVLIQNQMGKFFFRQNKQAEITRILTVEENRNDFSNINAISGISAEDFRRVVRDARAKLDALYDMSSGLSDSALERKVLSLTVTGNRIVDEVLRDPKDFSMARTWFNIHLDQVLSIVKGYKEVKGTNAQITADFNSTLDELVINFNNLLDHMKTNDLTALKVDMAVLNDQLKVENR